MADQELVILNQTTVATSNEGKIFLFVFENFDYRIVASTNTCYYSENQVFGGVIT